MRRFLGSSLLCAVVSGFAFPAMAADLSFQGRLEPLSIAGVVANAAGDNGFSIGVRMNRLVLRGTVSLQLLSVYDEERDEDPDSSWESKERYEWYLLTPGIQAQYYFSDTTPQSVVPFVSAKIAKAFAFDSESESWRSCRNDVCRKGPEDPDTPEERYDERRRDARRDMERSIYSPWIIALGGGLEFFPIGSVSIGMEAGLRLLLSTGSMDVEGNDQREFEKQRILGMHVFYGVFTLNYFW